MKLTVSERSRAYVRRRSQDHMNSYVEIYRDGDIEFNETTGVMDTPTRAYYYKGKARISHLHQEGTMLMGEIQMSLGSTEIYIPFDVDVHPKKDDVVVVLDNVNDETIDEHKFRVMSVARGGMYGPSISMTCVSFEDSAQWKYT